MSILTKKKTIKKAEEQIPLRSITIKEVQLRSKLDEGRSSGIGYGFLKKIDESTFETVNAISPCKDYLCEVILTENTGLGSSGCGLVYPKKNDLFSGKKAYLAALVQKSKSGYYQDYNQNGGYEADKKLLKDNYANTAKFLNYFEEKLGFKEKTEVKEANDDMYLIEMPVEWGQSLHAASLYTLLHRLSIHYDGTTDPMEWLTSYSKTPKEDAYIVKVCLTKIQEILKDPKHLKERKIVIENANKSKKDNTTSWSPHGWGIMAVDLKSESI